MPAKKKPTIAKKPVAAKPKLKKTVLTAKAKPKKPAPQPVIAPEAKPERYWEAIGRRKTALARVRLFTRGQKGLWVNNRAVGEYFPYSRFQYAATEALQKMKSLDRFRVVAKVSGGGPNAQAEAVRHATARVLVLFNPDFRKRLKRAGFLTRDPRMKERKKFGLKRARRAPQWAKR